MTAVFNPAKDKLHPDLYKIGFGDALPSTAEPTKLSATIKV